MSEACGYRAVITKAPGDGFYTIRLERTSGSVMRNKYGHALALTRWGARHEARKMLRSASTAGPEGYWEELRSDDFSRELRHAPREMRAAIAELRRDERAERAERIRAAQEAAFDAGFTACAKEHENRRIDPRHPITRTNPFGASK